MTGVTLSIRRRIPGAARLRRGGAGGMVRLSVAAMTIAVLTGVLAPWIAPYDPTYGDLSNTLAGTSSAHWLGTDQGGHDTLSVLISGVRPSLVGPLGVVVFSTLGGFLVGMVTAWTGGWFDSLISRALDILFAFPGLLLAILAVALFGKGLTAPVIAMAVAYLPYTARLVRGMVLQEKERPYVPAYVIQGHASSFVLFRRVMPNIAPTALAQSAVNFGYALLDLAALSFLGLGVQPPSVDWGVMISLGQAAVLAGAPLPAMAPAVTIVVVVVAFNILGEELADRLHGKDAR